MEIVYTICILAWCFKYIYESVIKDNKLIKQDQEIIDYKNRINYLESIIENYKGNNLGKSNN